MIIEQPAIFLRWLYPQALWRMDRKERAVYLTFDDGPIPEVTPWVLDVLDHYGIKATFFMVGDNVRNTDLFRPPHGWMKWGQYILVKEKYRVVMWDLVTRDYSKRLNGRDVLLNVRRYARPGSIITFHDSVKSYEKLTYALPRAIEWLRSQGYAFKVFD